MERETATELIRKAATGNENAFRQLVEAHQSFAWSLALRFVGDKDDAADLVQEAFIRVWKNLSRYNPEYQFSTWLGKVLTNLCLDFLRSRKRKNIMVQPFDQAAAEIGTIDTVENEMNHVEWMQRVVALSKQLPDKQQAVFILRDLEGLSVEEVSTMLEMSPGNIKSHLYYARVHIREGFKK